MSNINAHTSDIPRDLPIYITMSLRRETETETLSFNVRYEKEREKEWIKQKKKKKAPQKHKNTNKMFYSYLAHIQDYTAMENRFILIAKTFSEEVEKKNTCTPYAKIFWKALFGIHRLNIK